MDAQINLLIISDDFPLYESVKKAPVAEDFNVFFAQTGDSYLDVIRENGIRVVLVDAGDPPAAGLLIMKRIKKADALVDVLVGGQPLGREAVLDVVHAGATDYVPKPYERDILGDILRRISRKRDLRRETLHLEKRLERKYAFEGLISRNPTMLEIFSLIENIAKYFSSVLITGETGTGKEVVARAVHGLSPVKDRPLVVCDCASIPESLIESELFGYKPGAFTGAHIKGMRGKILQSDGGTLFLDEIGDMPLNLQTRMLRVLAEKEIVPLGSELPVKVNLNVVCATLRNLEVLVRKGQFREDLYFRLNGITIVLPPLREREDKALLIRKVIVAESGGRDLAITDEAFQVLLRYSWPGNIRELRNVVRYAQAVNEGGAIGVEDLPLGNAGIPSPSLPAWAMDRACSRDTEHPHPIPARERTVMVDALTRQRWNLSRAAKELCISRPTLYKKMRQHAIVPPHKFDRKA